MKLFEIDSTESIFQFISFLFSRTHLSFDPEVNISLLKNDGGDLIFEGDEGAYYEKIMNEAFLYCVFNKLNIYQIAHQVFESQQRLLAA